MEASRIFKKIILILIGILFCQQSVFANIDMRNGMYRWALKAKQRIIHNTLMAQEIKKQITDLRQTRRKKISVYLDAVEECWVTPPAREEKKAFFKKDAGEVFTRRYFFFPKSKHFDNTPYWEVGYRKRFNGRWAWKVFGGAMELDADNVSGTKHKWIEVKQFGLGLEYLLTKRLSIEGGPMYVDYRFQEKVNNEGDKVDMPSKMGGYIGINYLLYSKGPLGILLSGKWQAADMQLSYDIAESENNVHGFMVGLEFRVNIQKFLDKLKKKDKPS